jgi:RNA-splicing ligase RtcB
MLIYKGKFATANVMIDEIDETTISQIYQFVNHPAFKDCKIVIMPDCHAGKGAVVGFTMPLNDFIVPNVVGVDIGCGVSAYCLGNTKPDVVDLDLYIHKNIPHGFSHRQKPYVDVEQLNNSFRERFEKTCINTEQGPIEVLGQLGTLGGGNHFIEVDVEQNGKYWLIIHTGSRNFGLKVANFHQNKASKLIKEEFNGANAYKDLEYLTMDTGGKEYLEDMKVAQEFAHMNREAIAFEIIHNFFNLPKFSINKTEKIESIHNYIDFKDNILRKGAISAYCNERMIIPFNNEEGTMVGRGKDNQDWNFSAPHGAGRIMSRGRAKHELDLVQYQNGMKSAGIYTTTANKNTLDEAKGAYKKKELIIEAVKPTMDIEFFMKPIYNFKS